MRKVSNNRARGNDKRVEKRDRRGEREARIICYERANGKVDTSNIMDYKRKE